MNIPLMKIKGNFTRLVNIIMVDGWSVGGEDSKRPKSEKKKHPKMVVPTIQTAVKRLGVTNRNRRVMGIELVTMAKEKDASASPRSIAQKGTGRVSRRSNV